MIGADLVARILKQEGVDFMGVIPFNSLEEAAAKAGIRPLIFRQERVGVNLADAYTRVTNGRGTGVFAMQAGPGAENAFAGVAQAYADSVPILLLPASAPPAATAVTDQADAGPLEVLIRDARADDLPAIQRILNHEIKEKSAQLE